MGLGRARPRPRAQGFGYCWTAQVEAEAREGLRPHRDSEQGATCHLVSHLGSSGAWQGAMQPRERLTFLLVTALFRDLKQPQRPLCPGPSRPHQPGQAPQSVLFCPDVGATSDTASLPPSVRAPSCSWAPLSQILLLHVPQPRHRSLALGGWLHLPAHCEPHCGPGLGLKHTVIPTPDTGYGVAQHRISGCTCLGGGGMGGQRGGISGVSCFHSRWDPSSPTGLQH